VASVLVEWVGAQTTLVAMGLVCPVLAAAAWRRLRGLDRSVGALDAEVELLQRVPMFRTLPLPAVERLARGLKPVSVTEGHPVFSEGDIGDRYYLIEAGEADVVGDGLVVATLGPGEGFGEIALLRRTRRTAGVVARTDLRLQALDSDRFLPVVLGFTPSARAAGTAVDGMLERYEPKHPFGERPGPF
ncbi:MAG: cyclic nucleotide-binding domain-containing protein, partial [Mycetocola sp.]